MAMISFVTHPEVIIDASVPVPDWLLSPAGRSRIESFCLRPEIGKACMVYSSAERKAMDGAEIVSRSLRIPMTIAEQLGELDRSSTGYLPKTEHEATSKLAMMNPSKSVRGWERAIDAQSRIAHAIDRIRTRHQFDDVIVISHGGVGLLLLCSLLKVEISITHTAPNSNGGCFFQFDSSSGAILKSWQNIETIQSKATQRQT